MTLVLPTQLVQGTTANAPDVMSDLNAIVNYINNTIGPAQIPSGTNIAAFKQASAPTGWTQDTSTNDMVLRAINDGSGGATGGSWTISGLSGSAASHTHSFATPVHNHAVTINGHVLTTAELPSHVHNVSVDTASGGSGSGVGSSFPFRGPTVYTTDGGSVGNGAHAHTAPNTGNTANDAGGTTAASGALATTVTADGNWRPAYVNMLAATKN